MLNEVARRTYEGVAKRYEGGIQIRVLGKWLRLFGKWVEYPAKFELVVYDWGFKIDEPQLKAKKGSC